MNWRCGMRRQRRSWQGPPTKAYRECTLRRRNTARGVAGKQGTPSYFADRPQVDRTDPYVAMEKLESDVLVETWCFRVR